MSFATVRAYFPTNRLSRACFDFLANLFRFFVLALLSFFFPVLLPTFSSSFCVELWLVSFLVRGEI